MELASPGYLGFGVYLIINLLSPASLRALIEDEIYDFIDFLMDVYFQCSILNDHNFGRNRHVLILQKANENLFSLVLFSLLPKMIFKTH